MGREGPVLQKETPPPHPTPQACMLSVHPIGTDAKKPAFATVLSPGPEMPYTV